MTNVSDLSAAFVRNTRIAGEESPTVTGALADAPSHPGKSEGFGLPLVSVIITNFNYGRYLRGAIASVYSQTYPRIECILVDDASTDNSPAVLDEAEQLFSGLKIIRRTTNGGQCLAFREGFDASCGEYLVFLDADDVLLPGFVETHVFVHLSLRNPVGLSSSDMFQSTGERIVTAAIDNANAHIMSFDRRATNVLRRIDKAAPWLWTLENVESVIEDEIFLVDDRDFSEWRWSPTSGNCFRRDAVAMFITNQHLGDQRYAADNYLCRSVHMVAGSVIIDRPLGIYRIHGDNAFSRQVQLSGIRAYHNEKLLIENRQVWRTTVDHIFSNIPFFAENLTDFAGVLDALRRASAMDAPHDAGSSPYFLEKMNASAPTLLNVLGEKAFLELLARLRIDQPEIRTNKNLVNVVGALRETRPDPLDRLVLVARLLRRRQFSRILIMIGNYLQRSGL